MSSPTRRPSHDYTEGAAPQDIAYAVSNSRQTRRASQYSTPYGEEGSGSVFDGPGHVGIPSSVSRMSQHEGGRRSSGDWSRSRRLSQDSREDSRRGLARTDSGRSHISYGATEDDTYENDIDRRRIASPSRSPVPARASVFENLASMFGRGTVDSPPHSRRPSFSQISSTSRRLRRNRSRHSEAGSDYAIDTAESGDERWGYSSGEDDEEASSPEQSEADRISFNGSEMDSYPPSPDATTLPLLASDPIFGGETRIDMGVDFEPLAPPPPGLPSRQTIYIPDEDSNIRFIGYETRPARQLLWRVCCVLTCGIMALLGHWFPRFWLRWVSREKAFLDIKEGFVVVEVC